MVIDLKPHATTKCEMAYARWRQAGMLETPSTQPIREWLIQHPSTQRWMFDAQHAVINPLYMPEIFRTSLMTQQWQNKEKILNRVREQTRRSIEGDAAERAAWGLAEQNRLDDAKAERGQTCRAMTPGQRHAKERSD